MKQSEVNENAVAIVGMSCRFPDARNPDEFWQNLRDGRESVRDVTADDLLAAGYDPAILRHPHYVGKAVVLDGIDYFDAAFFGFSPRDAEILDPQQRLFLECAWEALEDAGYDPTGHDGPVGVFGGVDMSYYMFQLIGNPQILQSVGTLPITIANDKDYLATRVAYKLNLRGPAVTVQCACSTSLVAVCYACQSLLDFHCDVAIAGGSAISIPHRIGYVYQEGGISSPDGHCRAFDAKSQGTVGGSGAGVVVLKRLSEAIVDGDAIRAIIRGFAINNDGSAKVGYTAPSVEGQAEVISLAQAMARVSPDSVTYVEAHGTGTPLGDPIEIAALTKAFRAGTNRTRFCGVGTLKSNVGHMNSAAGVGGLIKTVLALQNKAIPANLHFERANPNIDFQSSPFYVVDRLQDWPANGAPRRAGVSSFGIGGTNAHVVVEETEPRPQPDTARPWHLLVLSARTPTALAAGASSLSNHLEGYPKHKLTNIAYTLAAGRHHFDHRRAILAPKENFGSLPLSSMQSFSGQVAPKAPSVVFLFPGQGAQYAGMSRKIYDFEPVFREKLDTCADLLRAKLDFDLRRVLFPQPDEIQVATERLKQTGVTQPVMFAVEYSLASLWMSWGVTPQAMLGHSIGEYVAACLAGVMTLEDAIGLVATRGALMQNLPPGAMLAATLPAREMTRYLRDGVSIAAINSRTQTVIAGPLQSIESIAAEMRSAGFSAQLLQTSHAFHSGMMDPILEEFTENVRKVRLNAPTIRYLSNFTGGWATADLVTDPGYWSAHLRSTVRFEECVSTLARSGATTFLEAGPGRTLSSLILDCYPRSSAPAVLPCLPPPKGGLSDHQVLLQALGQLWIAGYPVNWAGVFAHEPRQRVPLPTYHFERQRFWVDVPRPKSTAAAGVAASTNIPKPLDEWFYEPVWEPKPVAASSTAARNWVVFADDSSFARNLISKLERAGRRVRSVVARPRSLHGDGIMQIEPGVKAQYADLFRKLFAEGYMPDRIAHLWNIDADGGEATDAPPVRVTSFDSLLYIAQALAAAPNPVEIKVVSSGLHSIDGTESITPEKALLLGSCRVLPQENPNVQFSSIDISRPAESTDLDSTALHNLVRELTAERGDAIVAWRDGERWVQTYQRLRVPPAGAQHPRLQRRGVYLLTGGTGGIGLAIAEQLVRKFSARIVLLSRSPMPERSAWQDYTRTHGAEERTSRRLQKLLELENAGAELLVLQADVCNAEQLRRAAQEIEQRFGTLNGIIHSAGVAGGGMALLKTDAQASQVLAPKVEGVRALRDVFGSQALDFVALCSSLSTVLGGFGQVDYCAANCVLDACAYEWGGGSTHVVSIDWDTWGESGMAVETDVPAEMRQAKEENLRCGIRNRDGAEAFVRILATNAPQVLVSTTELFPRLQALAVGATHSSVSRRAAEPPIAAPKPAALQILSAAAAHPRPSLSSPFLAPTTDLQEKLASMWQELLGVGPLGIEDNFLELGGHSLLAIQLVARVRDLIGAEVPILAVFENPTIARLAAFIESAGSRVEGEPDLVPLPRELRSRTLRNGGPAKDELGTV
jgi:acyl transferase domain-containing protein/acyl carrier protein